MMEFNIPLRGKKFHPNNLILIGLSEETQKRVLGLEEKIYVNKKWKFSRSKYARKFPKRKVLERELNLQNIWMYRRTKRMFCERGEKDFYHHVYFKSYPSVWVYDEEPIFYPTRIKNKYLIKYYPIFNSKNSSTKY